MLHPEVFSFFDEPTNTATYILKDPASRSAAIVDSVLDYDAAAGRTNTKAADGLIAYVREHDLKVEWLLETHVHADHLSAAPYLKEKLGGTCSVMTVGTERAESALRDCLALGVDDAAATGQATLV